MDVRDPQVLLPQLVNICASSGTENRIDYGMFSFMCMSPIFFDRFCWLSNLGTAAVRYLSFLVHALGLPRKASKELHKVNPFIVES